MSPKTRPEEFVTVAPSPEQVQATLREIMALQAAEAALRRHWCGLATIAHPTPEIYR